MGNYSGFLHLSGDTEPPIKVEIDLSEERLAMKAGDVEVADWALDEIRVSAIDEGFRVRAEGEELILEVEEDGRFAVDLGIRAAPPTLRRRIAAALRSEETIG